MRGYIGASPALVRVYTLMKTITELDLPEPHKRTRSERCTFMVSTSGNGIGRRPMKRCRRFATHNFEGSKLCTQHAGSLALRYLMTTNEEGNNEKT